MTEPDKQPHEVMAFANCIENGRAILVGNGSEFRLLWQPEIKEDISDAVDIQVIPIEQVMLGEYNAYTTAMQAMISLAIRR